MIMIAVAGGILLAIAILFLIVLLFRNFTAFLVFGCMLFLVVSCVGALVN